MQRCLHVNGYSSVLLFVWKQDSVVFLSSSFLQLLAYMKIVLPHLPRFQLDFTLLGMNICMSAGQLPVGATTHFPQRSVFSAPILEHRPLRSDSSLPHSEPLQRQQQPTQSAMVQSQSVTHAQSAQPARSQSINPSQSAQQTSPVEPVLESPTQQEASSQQATSQTQPAVAAAAGGFQSDPTVSMQPSIQTPFNVVTSGESGQTAKQRQSNNSSAPACAGAGADRHCMGPPAVDGFTPHVSPFVAHSERSLHIQHAPHHPAPPAGEGPPHKKYNQGASSRSGSYNYGSNHNPAAAYPAQDLGNCYPPTYMQSHLSSQGSAGFNAMSQSASQCQFQQQQQQQQQQVPQSMPSWQGCEVRASPRHPGGSWNWSDGIGQTMGPNQMDGCCLNHSGSNNWDSQQAQSSQFSMPSQPDWSEQQPWRQQQTDVSGWLHVCLVFLSL